MRQIRSRNYKVSRWGIFRIIILVLAGQTVFAQLELVPYRGHSFGNPDSRARILSDTLALPFFDDFSSTFSVYADEALWENGGGVYVNNTLTVGQPSVNVATFDGTRLNGSPYNFENPLAQGDTDSLTSKPINLKERLSTDSLYLSFYWQAGGGGEKPDSSDSFRLEFLNNRMEWVTVWQQIGYQTDTLFHQKLLAINNPVFYHQGFRFRFISYGRNSGRFDLWNLDYVYLNVKRSANDTFIRDSAIKSVLSPFFKKYTAIPLEHYLVNPSAFTQSSVSATVGNLNNREDYLTFAVDWKDLATGKDLGRSTQPSTYLAPKSDLLVTLPIKAIVPGSAQKGLKLKYSFYASTNDSLSLIGVDLRRNDTLSAYADLTDYYSYDDRSAEYGIQLNQKLGKVVVQYVLAKPDTIGGIRMSIIPFVKDISGLSFTAQIWSNKDGKPDKILTQQSFPARYGADPNALQEYTFSKSVAVADTFYIGWLQVSDQPLTVGFDFNSNFGSDKVWYDLGTEWVKETGLRGSIMIHPFLTEKGRGVITGTEPSLSDKNLFFYPNPNRGFLQWDNFDLTSVSIYLANGYLLKVYYPEKGARTLNLGGFPNGIYVIKANVGAKTFAQRMIIQN